MNMNETLIKTTFHSFNNYVIFDIIDSSIIVFKVLIKRALANYLRVKIE